MRAPTNGDGTGRGPWLSAALIGGVVAGAVCGGMVVFLGEREAGAVAPGSASNEALVRELRTLTAELTALRDELERTRLAADSTPAASLPSGLAPGAAGPDVAALSAALTAALDRLSQQLGTRSPGLLPPQIDTVKRKQLKPVYDSDDQVHDFDYWDAERESRRQEHLLWTSGQILDAYGRPDSISPGDYGRVKWRYEISPSSEVTFTFLDGLVADVD